MEKKVEISMLCEMYGKLLTEKQYIFIEDYYNNDLSLSEIAENENITRQAVRDIIKKAENKLMEMEDKLGLMKKQTWQKKTNRNNFKWFKITSRKKYRQRNRESNKKYIQKNKLFSINGGA